MPQKRTPYYFLIVLLLILCFIIGLRWGQNIEKTNKVVNYLVSIAPTATLVPTQPPLAFNSYKHVGCGITFLYPSVYKIEKESSQEARLTQNGALGISFSCFPQTITERPKTNPDWVTTFKNQQIVKQGYGNDAGVFMVKNPLNGKWVTIYVADSFYPLLEKGFDFTK